MIKEVNNGFFYALGAFLMWGFIPAYWKPLGEFNPLELLAYRILFSLVYLGFILVFKKKTGFFFSLFKKPEILLPFFATAILISINWGVFIVATTSGKVMQTSLGYFMVPLINILLGIIFLGERFSRRQNLSVLLLVVAVGWEISSNIQFPWIALSLGFSFGFYGLLRKKVKLDPFSGLALETTFLVIPAIAYLVYDRISNHSSNLFDYPLNDQLYISLTGIISILPLALFAKAAASLKLSTLGLMNYITPTLHFVLALVLFNQTAHTDRLITFGIIWTALFLYSLDSLSRVRK